MKILSIETSCDETAVSLVEASGDNRSFSFSVLGNALFSQIEMHREYGGVFPTVAKREHAKKFPLLLKETLSQGDEYVIKPQEYSEETWEEIRKITEKEGGLFDGLKEVLSDMEKPNIDIIAVTAGPGLEPALWVGISCAKALGALWGIPVMPVNHMEGHITSVFMESEDVRKAVFPAVALLISGGHTELVEVLDWGKYNILGQTRDDAVGEAFDKVARMLGLPYPGGPEVSKLAEMARKENLPQKCKLPRPMIHSDDFDFSFSGLKTAVLYYIRDNPLQNEDEVKDICREFEDTVVDVLLSKTKKAVDHTGAQTLIIAGGVIANKRLREKFKKLEDEFPGLIVKTPSQKLSTDNALMIASSAYLKILENSELLKGGMEIKANGNLRLS